MKADPKLVSAVRDALVCYTADVNATAMTDSSKKTYLLHAEHFVRWIEGDFTPGLKLQSGTGSDATGS